MKEYSRTISVTNAIGVTKTCTYDEKGRLATSVNGRGQETQFTYDAYDRLISAKDELGTTEYTYTKYGWPAGIRNRRGWACHRVYLRYRRASSYNKSSGWNDRDKHL